jgi:hypothetical protein
VSPFMRVARDHQVQIFELTYRTEAGG